MPGPTNRLIKIVESQAYMGHRYAHRQLMYGLTRDEVIAMVSEQDGYCALCGTDLLGKKWAIDHNHETKKVRGIVCYNCNVGLGKLGGTIRMLEAAIAYLRRNGETQ
jgi:hypothetical protein